MFALSRFRTYLLIAVWLFSSTLVINGVLRLLDATPVLGWLPKVTSGTGYLEDSRQRVAGAWQEYQQGQVRPEQYLCAIIGLSNVREAVPLKTVSDEAGVPCRYLGLGGAGVGMPDVYGQAKVLLSSELYPDLVLVGIGPHQLVDTRPKPGSLQQGFLDYLQRRDFRNAAIEIRNWLWFYTRRQDISLTVEAALLDARANLFRWFGVHLQESESNQRSPWREMIQSIFVEHFSEATLKEEEQFFADLGVFDRQTYASSSKAPATLVSLIEDFRARGAAVVVVLMPEHSRLRKRMPPTIIEVVTTPLRQAFGDDMPPVVDLRDTVEDSGFVDLTHLNQTGRARCGRLVGAEIRLYFPSHPPLMSSPPYAK